MEHWKENSTKENIFRDELLPLYWQLRSDYENGNIVVICTARELGKYDLEFIHSMGIYYDYIYSRPKNNPTKDEILKNAQLRHFGTSSNFANSQNYSMMIRLRTYDKFEKWEISTA